MNRKFKTVIRDGLRLFLGRYLYTWLRFVITHRYIPNFKHPRSMNEKIIHRKFYDDPKKYSRYTSKYTVREYVKEAIGEEYLIPLYKAKSFITPADFDELPDSFVIKTSNGGGGNNVQIVKNKEDLNLQDVCNRFNGYLKIKAGKGTDELFYDLEEPLILFEKLLLDTTGAVPPDYKFNIIKTGSEPYIFIQVDEDRFSAPKRSFIDANKNILNFNWGENLPPISEDFTFPESFKEMLSLAIQLASPFQHVRVDLYVCNDKIFFGELTFCTASGFSSFSDKKYDFEFGTLWDEY